MVSIALHAIGIVARARGSPASAVSLSNCADMPNETFKLISFHFISFRFVIILFRIWIVCCHNVRPPPCSRRRDDSFNWIYAVADSFDSYASPYVLIRVFRQMELRMNFKECAERTRVGILRLPVSNFPANANNLKCTRNWHSKIAEFHVKFSCAIWSIIQPFSKLIYLRIACPSHRNQHVTRLPSTREIFNDILNYFETKYVSHTKRQCIFRIRKTSVRDRASPDALVYLLPRPIASHHITINHKIEANWKCHFENLKTAKTTTELT